MNDDIRQAPEPHRFPKLKLPSKDKDEPYVPVSPDLKATETVDEAKIEREFGPPPTAWRKPEARSVTAKIAGLLPAFAKGSDGAVARRPRRLKWVLLALGFVIVAGATATSYLILTRYNPPVIHATVPIVKPKPKPPALVPSTLTGLPVDPSVNSRPVTAVMIENSIDARPQSGLDQAGVVFEALAEGGVTRFMALYQDTQPDYLGPVRSARPYYIQWLLGFDAAYAHVGGSPDALSDITAWHVKDLNQFYNSAAYHRISTRYAPHNVYTSIAELNQLEASKGFTTSIFTGFVRKKEAPAKTPTVTSIDLKFSGIYYDAHFDYDAATNTYKRSESGAPHLELHKDGTQVQIAPKVVVAMITPRQNGALDSSGAYYSDYAALGSGQVVIFQDGVATPGTWAKPDRTTQLTFADANGQPLALDTGQTWISAVPASTGVVYK